MPTDNILLFRELAAILFIVDLIAFAPYAKVCLGAGYWKGTPLEHDPVRWAVYAAWLLGSASLLTGVYPLVGALTLLFLFRRIYIKGRWKTLFRGGGAPGFMSHYTVLYVTLFEIARLVDPTGGAMRAVWLMFRIDFGVVLLCSGTYKSLSGYLSGEGMEYGLANPMWSYFWPFFLRVRPGNLFLQTQDRIAALSQVVMGGLLALSPLYAPLGWVGAALCIQAFGYLVFTVRLGRLAVLMMLAPLPYLPDLGFSIGGWLGTAHASPALALPSAVPVAFKALCWAYIVALPLVKAMQYTNLFLSRTFPEPLQRFLTAYANWVPIIMWRVFTPDVTNFFIRIRRLNPATGETSPFLDENTTYSYFHFGDLRRKLRYLHVTESIALTTVFTTLKYFRSKRELFEKKLVAYTRTLGDGAFEFEYVAILKGATRFDYLPVSRFRVDTATGSVAETELVPDFDYAAPAAHSHIKETTGYGSYVPARTQ